MSTSKSQQKLSDRYASKTTGSKGSATARGRKLMAPLVVIAASAAVFVIVIIATFIAGGNNAANSYNLVVTPDNIDKLLAENTQTVAAGSYDVCMNSTWTFANAQSASTTAYVENVIGNTHTVNFTLVRNDTGTEIYSSPYIPVGSSLSNIKLSDESLKKGTYPCTVTYHLVDEQYNEVSKVSISVSVIIEADNI